MSRLPSMNTLEDEFNELMGKYKFHVHNLRVEQQGDVVVVGVVFLEDMRGDKPNCVTCDHFGKCEGCEKRDEE